MITGKSSKPSRRLRPDVDKQHLRECLANHLRSEGVAGSLVIAVVFFLVAAAILALRANVVAYRPGQHVNHDIVARVGFTYPDKDKLLLAKDEASRMEPRVYAETRPVWSELEQFLVALPERVKGKSLDEIRADFDKGAVLDNAAVGRLQEYAELISRRDWDDSIRQFIARLRESQLVLLSDGDRANEINRQIRLGPSGPLIPGNNALTPTTDAALQARLEAAARQTLAPVLADKVVKLTKLRLTFEPTHELDESETKRAQTIAEDKVPPEAGDSRVPPNQRIVSAGVVHESDWVKLRHENAAYRQHAGLYREYAGLVGGVALLTVALCAYIARYQPRVVRNHGRGVALAVLLLATLLVAQLAGIGSGQLYFLGVAPTILVAMTLAIAYDQRFAIGVAAAHAALVTLALSQPAAFFLVLLAGSATCSLTMHNLRSRSQLINIAGLTGIALFVASFFAGLMHGDPVAFILVDAGWAALSGLSVGFFLLGVMPFVEHVFRISTGMSLLELADFSNPLLRKLAAEAPGTYQHSMQVSVLAEEAANAIGANALLTRVGAYYHDIGKVNKAEYFVENQQAGQQSRHLTLNPNVSMLIIVGHVKDGLALAREYNLPTCLTPFIQSHHGTTLIEYFYHRAVKQEEAKRLASGSGGNAAEDGDAPEIDEHQFRYPGPKPRSKEVAILMIADAAESACRTIEEPSAARIESLVHDILIKRLLDGQFDECDITMRELELVERSMIRTLIGIYHARIAYPSDQRKADDRKPDFAAPDVADGKRTASA